MHQSIAPPRPGTIDGNHRAALRFKGHSRSGAFLILGLGGTFWNETRTRNYGAPFFDSERTTDTDLGFAPTFGFGYRINPHVALEVRHAWSFLPTKESDRPYGDQRNYLSVGASFRF